MSPLKTSKNLKTSPMNLFPNCSSRCKEALNSLKYEPRSPGCYGALNPPQMTCNLVSPHLSPATCHLSL
jgi:hypothetical protein